MSEERDPKYTVAVCNYNMADTLEESLRSILDQLDERFEVLVVDDGSTDGSQEILDKLEEEYEILRWIEGDNDNIGEARAQANRDARGDYIIVQLDADDKFEPVIQDLVRIYHKIEENREDEFFFGGMAPKTLLTRINYRSMGRGEDRDLWRRLAAEGKFLALSRDPFWTPLGYEYGKIDMLKNGYETTKNIFRSGVTWRSFFKYKILNAEYRDDLYRAVISPVAYLHARTDGIYELPEGYENFAKGLEEIEKNEKSIKELENKYGFKVKEELSERGKEILYNQ